MNSPVMRTRRPEIYKIIQSPVTGEIKVKGSRFVENAVPVKSTEEADTELARISRKYHDATHNCFAYQIGVGDAAIYRTSDAGEPAGTAGKPILQVIQGMELTNILVVVTRYFGGTKLGIGGLIKAYTEVTQKTLQKAKIVEVPILQRYYLKIDYTHLNQVMRDISAFGVRISDSDYGEYVQLQVDVPVGKIIDFQSALVNGTGGQVKFKRA